jgi:hypothetical protein
LILSAVSLIFVKQQFCPACCVEASDIFFQVRSSTTPDAIAVLARGLELAAILGKAIVFDSLDLATYIGLRSEWRSSREICFGPWGDLFEGEFEQFLTDEMLRSLPCEAVKPTFLQFAKLYLPSG